MNNSSNNPQAPLTMEEGIKALFADACQGIRHRRQVCEDSIRQSPTKSVLGAAAVGYVLHRLPVRAILVANVRILSALAPPALLLFGTAKLYEYLQRQNLSKEAQNDESPDLFDRSE